jgi:hypothetical protein
MFGRQGGVIYPSAGRFFGGYEVAGVAIVTATPLTLACWCHPGGVAANADTALICIGNSGVALDSFNLTFRTATTSAANFVRANVNSGAGAASTAAAPAFRWIHAAAVFTSSTSRQAFANGIPSSIDTTSVTPAGLNHTTVGQKATGAGTIQVFQGGIAHAAIWNIALANSDIMALYQGTLPPLVRGDALVAYWPLMFNGPLPIGDDYKQAHNLTLISGQAPPVGPFPGPLPYLSIRGRMFSPAVLMGQACL